MTCYHHLDGNEVSTKVRNAYKVLVQEGFKLFLTDLRCLYLLPGEDVLVEVKLDLLVGDVDAKLLEGVLLEVLEAEDVQDADVQAFVVLSGGENKKVSSHLKSFPLLLFVSKRPLRFIKRPLELQK